MSTLAEQARARGVQLSYFDAFGVERQAPESTLEAVLTAMGPADDTPGPLIAHVGDRWRIEGAVEVGREDGGTVVIEGELPGDLPAGYHSLHFQDGEARSLIVSPGGCHLPDGLRSWGWAVQLYAVRSAASWGMGDLADLRELNRWSRELGAGVVMLNPLHASNPTPPIQPSPYFASSRRFRDPLYLRPEEVPGAHELASELAPIGAAARELLSRRVIDRDEVHRLKMQALELIWSRFEGAEAFDRFCTVGGTDLQLYAVFCVLSEFHGRPWTAWPSEYRHPGGDGVAAFAAEHSERLRFHAWLQWLVSEQLANAGDGIGVINDLAIGADPDGADAWAWQDVVARGVEVGAPPDDFNTQGQKWGFPPFDPGRLRAAGYRPFIDTLRWAFQHSGGIRIDHVLGLFRLFWIPVGAAATEGVYVRYPTADLLDIVALESQRAGAFVVGEDLGTLEDGVREELAARRMLSYRVFWFEDRPPSDYPAQALAAVTTHDLPTVAGLWTGADQRAQEEAGQQPNADSMAQARGRLEQYAGVSADAPLEDVVRAAYGSLANAPSALLMATLEDAVCAEERPNLPGTTNEQWPDWSLALPATLEEIESAPLAAELGRALNRYSD